MEKGTLADLLCDNPDSLERVYLFQKRYQEALGYTLGGTEHMRRNVLYAFAELAELLDEIPGWKWHRPDGHAPDRERLVGEFADVFVFLLNVLVHAGVSVDELRAGVTGTLVKNLNRLEDGTNRREKT